jgi:uncharacterized protein YggE
MGAARLGFLLVFAMVAGVAPAAAQTVLSLSAIGNDTVSPDQMVASLTAQASAGQAREAAALLNAAMAKALAAARATAGVTAVTSDYSEQNVTDETGKTTGYQASETLSLTMAAPGGAPPAVFTALAGRLQQQGLLLNDLDGSLSSQGQAAAQAAAITDAIRQVKATAAAVAATLGDQVGAIKTLDVNDETPGPIMPGRMMAMAATAPPPQAAPGPITASATVTAQIVLVGGK